MSSNRALANQSLYLARVQLQAWERAKSEQQHPVTVIERAFAPAVRNHLLDAFGWFALHVLGVSEISNPPPHRCAELPVVAEGKSVPGEIREFRILEESGWLGELQATPVLTGTASRSSGNLASEASSGPDIEQMSEWADRLERIFDRMGDSLDEC